MEDLKANISLNIEVKSSDFLTEIKEISAVYKLSLEQIVSFALKCL